MASCFEGLLFQFLTLVQPALVIGAPCVAILLLGVWAPRCLLERPMVAGAQLRERIPTDAHHANAGERNKPISSSQ